MSKNRFTQFFERLQHGAFCKVVLTEDLVLCVSNGKDDQIKFVVDLQKDKYDFDKETSTLSLPEQGKDLQFHKSTGHFLHERIYDIQTLKKQRRPRRKGQPQRDHPTQPELPTDWSSLFPSSSTSTEDEDMHTYECPLHGMSQRQRAWEPESHETTTHSPTTETSLSLITPQQETQPEVEGHIGGDKIISEAQDNTEMRLDPRSFEVEISAIASSVASPKTLMTPQQETQPEANGSVRPQKILSVDINE
jgi:hypothetical protein